MSFVKNTLDFFKRNVLPIRAQKQVIDHSKLNQPRTMPTFRTYTLGGDPFNDRIEFFLTRDSKAGGFGDPVALGEVRKATRAPTEAEIRAAFGCPERKD